MIDQKLLADFAISIMIVLGAGFALIGSWGLARLPTLMDRLHGPTKATTLGLGGILVGSMLFFLLDQGQWSAHELLVSLFLFITAPIAANMIAKVHIHELRVRRDSTFAGRAGNPPSPPGKADWATYEAPHPDSPASTLEK
jgi:multicomponent K+:H+ antiporter subunit G